jgi:hypothetical protein
MITIVIFQNIILLITKNKTNNVNDTEYYTHVHNHSKCIIQLDFSSFMLHTPSIIHMIIITMPQTTKKRNNTSFVQNHKNFLQDH